MAEAIELKEQPAIGVSGAPAVKQKRNIGILVKNPLAIVALLVVVVVGAYFGIRYWQDLQSKVYIENSEISAPLISISPETAGALKVVYVKEGDRVAPGQQLFSVAERVTSARTAGIITAVQNTPGQWATQQSVIVQMYDPTSLRIVGHIQEDQGLSDIKIGQKVTFTVDAFDNREYTGTVETIGNTADQSSVVFSISDKRQEKQFDVKIAFDVNAYPELRNGMSARMWIHK